MDYCLQVNRVVASSQVIQTGLPQPPFTTPLGAPSLPAWVDVFTPPFGALAQTYSSIASFQRNVPPGRLTLVMGDNMTGSAKLAVYGQTTSGNGKLSLCQDATGATGNVRLTGNNLKAIIDPTQASGALLLSLFDYGNYGPSVMSNIADAWWLASSSIGAGSTSDGSAFGVAGDTISIHGRELVEPVRSTSSVTIGAGPLTFTVPSGLGFSAGSRAVHIHVNGPNGAVSIDGTATYSGTTLTVTVVKTQGSGTYSDWSIYHADYTNIWMYAVTSSSGQFVASSAITSVSPYRIQFTALGAGTWPTGLSAQDYNLYVHNGQGGSYGWSNPAKLTVTTLATFNPGSTGAPAGALNFAANTFTLGTATAAAGHGNDGVNNSARDFAVAVSDVLTYMANNSMLSATVTLQAGTYYMLSTFANTRNIKFVGQGSGGGGTVIQTWTGFDDHCMFDCTQSGGYCSWFKDLKLDSTTGGTLETGVGNEAAIKGGLWIRLDNVVIDTRNAFWFGLNYGQNYATAQRSAIVNSCTFTGMGILGQTVPLLVDSCSFIQAQIGFSSQSSSRIGPIGVAGGSRVSVTNCTTQDLGSTQTTVGSGRFVVFLPAICECCYIAGNKSTNLTGAGANDTNQGEQMFWEGDASDGGGAVHYGTATGNNITANTVEVVFNSGGIINVGWQIQITSGKGAGQWGVVTAISGNIYTIHRNWLVLPDATSVIAMSGVPSRTVIYNNDLSTGGTFFVSSCVASIFSSVSFGCIIDGNSGNNQQFGTKFQGGQNGSGSIGPAIRAHCEMLQDRNKFTGIQHESLQIGSLRRNVLFRDIQGAVLSGVTANAIDNGINSDGVEDFDAFDGGTFTGANTAIYISSGTTGEMDLLNVTFDANPNATSSHKCNPTGGGGPTIPGISGPAALGTTAFNNYANP